MVTIGTLWMPILVSAVLVFIASFLAWVVSPHHKSDWKKLPDEEAVRAAMNKEKLEPGQYMVRLEQVGFVFQAYNLLPVLTALENAEFPLLLQGVEEAERQTRVRELFERTGLKGLENRRPGKLSGGQQQRVAVVRAVASRPALVLADEPTANLDTTASEALLDMMVELNQELGTTFVFATHDARVMERSRRLVRLIDGTIHSDETR